MPDIASNDFLENVDQEVINSYVEELGRNMEVILNILPQEILDNFSIGSPGV